jgi:PKD repeat protein
MADWVMFSDGLPVDASITEIEIFYDAMDPAGDILRAGTYGRGLWESGVYHSSPSANFEANETLIPPGCGIEFKDLSSGVPTNWNWQFTGATPSTSSERNPSGITYDSPGTYQVKLVVTNEAGADSVAFVDYITVDETILPLVDFTADQTVVCTNGIISFTDLTLYCPGSWLWSFTPNTIDFKEGTSETSQNPIVEFRQSGNYTVTLTVTNNNGEASHTRTDYIKAGGYNLPFQEDFETGNLGDRNWIVRNPDMGFTWTSFLVEETGNHSAQMKFYGYYKMAERDQLISPYFNFSELSNVYLTFDHAYAQRFSQKDSLIVYVSSGCEEDWTRVWANGPDGNGIFETSSPSAYEFIPTLNDDWCGYGWGADCFTLDLSQWAGIKNVQIMFEAYNNMGNNLYLDNITVSNTTGNVNIIPALGTFTIYPNPGTGYFTLLTSGITGEMQVEVFNAQGQSVMRNEISNANQAYRQAINLAGFPKGVYVVKLTSGDKVQTMKLILE